MLLKTTILVLALLLPGLVFSEVEGGHFDGTLQLEPIGDGVHMTVLKRYSYTDLQGHSLVADPGFITDGASIPRYLWTVIGSPFTGKYVGAAVVHDVGCVSHKYTWQLTDRMFYEAMITEHVDSFHAKTMYYAVRLRGPHWKEVNIDPDSLGALRTSIEAKGGTVEINRYPSSSASSKSSNEQLPVLIYQPSQLLRSDELDRFIKLLKESERAHKPVSLDEIDRLTENADSSLRAR